MLHRGNLDYFSDSVGADKFKKVLLERKQSVGGIVVSIAAFQAVNLGSIPGRRKFSSEIQIKFRTFCWKLDFFKSGKYDSFGSNEQILNVLNNTPTKYSNPYTLQFSPKNQPPHPLKPLGSHTQKIPEKMLIVSAPHTGITDKKKLKDFSLYYLYKNKILTAPLSSVHSLHMNRVNQSKIRY